MLTLIPFVILGFLCSLGFTKPLHAANGLSTRQDLSLICIWKDSGSGADMDFSVYRPINMPIKYRSLGDIPVPAHSYQLRIGFIGKEIKSDGDTFKDPLNFYPIWNDCGSGAD